MKKLLVISSVVFALGYVIAIAAHSAALISFSVLGLRVLIAGVIVCGLVSLLSNDYLRRPRFRVRRSGQSINRAATFRNTLVKQPACDWTYTTRSA